MWLIVFWCSLIACVNCCGLLGFEFVGVDFGAVCLGLAGLRFCVACLEVCCFRLFGLL